MDAKLHLILALALLTAGMAGGCQGALSSEPALYERLQASDPGTRLDAIVEACDRRDPQAVPLLVEQLMAGESDVRMMAFLALRKMTGQTFGYKHYGSASQREESQRRWRQWLRQNRPALPVDPNAPEGQVP